MAFLVVVGSCRRTSSTAQESRKDAPAPVASSARSETSVVSAIASPDAGESRCTPLGRLPRWRRDLTATQLADGRILVVGGQQTATGPRLTDVDLLDPTAGSITPAEPLHHARARHRAIAAKSDRHERVLVAGGMNAVVETYDVASHKWLAIGKMGWDDGAEDKDAEVVEPIVRAFDQDTLYIASGETSRPGEMSEGGYLVKDASVMGRTKCYLHIAGGLIVKLEDGQDVLIGARGQANDVPVPGPLPPVKIGMQAFKLEAKTSTPSTRAALAIGRAPFSVADLLQLSFGPDDKIAVSTRGVFRYSVERDTWEPAGSFERVHEGGAAVVTKSEVVVIGGASEADAIAERCALR